jgi:hypothetical protein
MEHSGFSGGGIRTKNEKDKEREVKVPGNRSKKAAN